MRVLAIGAHCDDVELGCGGTLLKHRDVGDELFIVVVTHSGYESATKGMVRNREDAIQEGLASAKVLRAEFACLEKEPLTLVPNERLVLDLESVISRIKPDRVYTHRSTDCHSDHAAIGYASVRAARKCDAILIYRSNWYITDNVMEDNFYVDISANIEQKKDLIRLFESEMRQVDYSWIDFVTKQNCAAGAKISTNFAETFQLAKMLWR